MIVIPKKDFDFDSIEEMLGKNPDRTRMEMVAGIDCDEEELEHQREAGDDDPIATIELIAQWSEETREGILDWYFERESSLDLREPEVEHGGSLLAFRYAGGEPDLDKLLPDAIPALNASVDWAEFAMCEEE